MTWLLSTVQNGGTIVVFWTSFGDGLVKLPKNECLNFKYKVFVGADKPDYLL